MKTIHNISIAYTMAALAAGVSIITLTSGCQTPGKVLSVETSDVCPACKLETVTSPIKGQIYTRCVCPSCRRVRNERYPTIDDTHNPDAYVHVCTRCEAVVEDCPVCRKEAAGG